MKTSDHKMKIIGIAVIILVLGGLLALRGSPPGCEFFEELIENKEVERQLSQWYLDVFPDGTVKVDSQSIGLDTSLFPYVLKDNEAKERLPSYLEGASVKVITNDDKEIRAVFFGFKSRSGLVLFVDKEISSEFGFKQSLTKMRGRVGVICME